MIVAFLTVSRFLRSVPPKIWALAAVVMLVGVVIWQIDRRAYTRGYDAADEQWLVRVAEEHKRQVAANEEALQRARAEIERLLEAKGVRDATIERLTNEANRDPDAGRVAIGAPSVRRLNEAAGH